MAAADPEVEGVLDLERLPAGEYWGRIMDAVRALDRRSRRWRLAVRVADTPEASQELPHLLRHLDVVGLAHDVTRGGDGAQTFTLARRA